MVYGDFKDLNIRKLFFFSDKVLFDKAFNIAKNKKNDGYQRGIVLMIYKCFDKNTAGRTVKKEIISNQELTEELPKLIIRKFNKRKVHSSFIDKIWGAYLADIQLISKFNEGFRSLLCAIFLLYFYVLLYIFYVYSKYACVIPIKDKKRITICNAFQKIVNESNRKANKIWVD